MKRRAAFFILAKVAEKKKRSATPRAARTSPLPSLTIDTPTWDTETEQADATVIPSAGRQRRRQSSITPPPMIAKRTDAKGGRRSLFSNPIAKAHLVSAGNTIVRRTHTAGALRQLYAARLLRIVDELIASKMCSVVWPAWQASLRPLHDSAETLELSARHRMPRIYILIVHLSVYVTIGVDFFFVATYTHTHTHTPPPPQTLQSFQKQPFQACSARGGVPSPAALLPPPTLTIFTVVACGCPQLCRLLL